MKNEIIAVDFGERIRKNPHYVFDYDDIRGVHNAFKGLLSIFSEEASRGHGEEIDVFLFDDSSLAIKLASDRGMYLGEIGDDEDAWKERLLSVVHDSDRYIEFLFSYAPTESVKSDRRPCYDKTNIFPALACNQYVTEFMTVHSARGPYGSANSVSFRKGKPVSGLSEAESGIVGTFIHFKYDSDVFTDVAVSKEFLCETLREAAMLNAGIKYVLEVEDENGDVSYEECYCYGCMSDYIEEINSEYRISPVFECCRKIDGKDKATQKEEYTAKIRMGISFTENAPSSQCYYNEHRLDKGGAFLDELYKRLCGQVNFISVKNDMYRSLTTVLPEDLKKHLVTVFDIRTVGCIPSWGDGRRESLNNRMITELVEDVCSVELEKFIDSNEAAVLDFIGLVKAERKHEEKENTFADKLEKAISVYENGAGKTDFLNCLMSAPRGASGFACLREHMHREACNSEPLYYYVLLTDFAEHITADIYQKLSCEYKANIDDKLPDFFCR